MINMNLNDASRQVSVVLLVNRSGIDKLNTRALRYARTKAALEADNTALAISRLVR
jgi:hypothetical protein